MIAVLWSKAGKWFAGIAAGTAMLFGIFYAGKKAGKADELQKYLKQQIAENEKAHNETVEKITAANEISSAVNRLDADAVRDKLRDEWTRN